jgi:uncharacterized protein YkwD/LysM repeat protein
MGVRLATNLFLATLLLVAGWLFSFKPNHRIGVSAVAAAGSGREVIDLVNQLRAADGLAPYRVNDALMAAAQGHSDWMAETGTTAHTGLDGSSPAARAAAAGYPGSGVIENIASGSSMTPAIAIRIWQGDALHLATLLSSTSEDAGAGVATGEDGVTFITLDVGGRGSDNQGRETPLGQATPPGGAAPLTPMVTPPIAGIQTATPKADGSILHTVELGQTLWSIAISYKISLNDLYTLNGLNEQSVIIPGERLTIRLASQTLTPTLPTTGTGISTISGTAGAETLELSSTPASPTQTVAPTEKPTPTLRTAALEEKQATGGPTGALAEETRTTATDQGGIDLLLLAIAAFALVGAGLMLVGALLKRSTSS